MQLEYIKKIDLSDGDVVLITLPNIPMSNNTVARYENNIRANFREVYPDNNIVFVPYGVKVEILSNE